MIAVLLLAALTIASTPAPVAIATLDLTHPFRTRSAWSFDARQGPPIADPIVGGTAPGAITPCLRREGGACDRTVVPRTMTSVTGVFEAPHFLDALRIVQPRGRPPLLLIRTASLHSGDGGQLVETRLLAYDRGPDRFRTVYDRAVGHNNDQEVRYIAGGPLDGDVIAAAPTSDAPFAFWMTVSQPGSDGRYAIRLRYRTATTYGDGNPLAVIDSEMPNIERRLGLWRPGQRLPLPAGQCPRPHLAGMELWCR